MNLTKSIITVGILSLLIGCNNGETQQNSTSDNVESNVVASETTTVPKAESAKSETLDNSSTRNSSVQTSSVQTSSVQNSSRPENTGSRNQNKNDNPREDNLRKDNVKKDSVRTDNLIVPGKRVGFITKSTTRQDLVEKFGESNLKDDVSYQAEGTVKVPVTRINEGKKDYLVLEWKDDSRKQLNNVVILGSEWKTPEGISVGTSLQKLENIVGEFKFSGLAWDFGGIVQLQNTKVANYREKMSLRVGTDDSDESQKLIQKYSDEYGKIVGDTLVSSNDLNARPFNIKVDKIDVFLNAR